MNKKQVANNYIMTGIMLICFIVFTALVATVDVKPVGELGTKVGFASLNGQVYKSIGFNETCYKISELLGYASILLVGVWGVIGLIQLIKGKSIKKVDWKLFVLAGSYVVMLALYVLFNKVVINYRPVIVDVKEGIEPAYPSSHTFLAIYVCLSAVMLYRYYIKKDNLRRLATIGTLLLMVFAIVFRLLSGAHWLTDIVGAIMLGTTLVSAFISVLSTVEYKIK